MQVTVLNKKAYEKVCKNSTNDRGKITTTKPSIDRDNFKLYKYEKCIEVYFNIDDLKAIDPNNNPIPFTKLLTKLDKDIEDNIELFNIKIDTHTYTINNLEDAVVDCFPFHTPFSFLLYDTRERVEVTTITKKEQEMLDKNKEIQNKKKIIDTFMLPYIQPILDKYNLILDLHNRDNTPDLFANIKFSSYESLVTFIMNCLLEKIGDDFKKIGIDLIPNKINKSKLAVSQYDAFFNIYNSNIILNESK